MLETIFGNKTAAHIMLYLFHYGEAYGSGISKDMKITLSQVQKQLDKFETAGILVSKKMGTVRIYTFNPKLGVVKKITELIKDFYEAIPISQREVMFNVRRRPRRKGKPVIKNIINPE
jgi:DNA-binding transcriptional ArsR family regulator